MWMSASIGTRYVITWISASVNVCFYRYVITWISASVVVCFFGCLLLWLSASVDVCFSGCLLLWMSAYNGSLPLWLLGSVAACLVVFNNSGTVDVLSS